MASKRIIIDNTSANGSLDSDEAARSLLQHRNTPIPQIRLSLAQMLLHRQLRDSVPVNPKFYRPHKEWVVSAKEREIAYARRNEGIIARYNQIAHPLKELKAHTPVLVQESGKWKRAGQIVEVLPNRQYNVRMDGSGRIVS